MDISDIVSILITSQTRTPSPGGLRGAADPRLQRRVFGAGAHLLEADRRRRRLRHHHPRIQGGGEDVRADALSPAGEDRPRGEQAHSAVRVHPHRDQLVQVRVFCERRIGQLHLRRHRHRGGDHRRPEDGLRSARAGLHELAAVDQHRVAAGGQRRGRVARPALHRPQSGGVAEPRRAGRHHRGRPRRDSARRWRLVCARHLLQLQGLHRGCGRVGAEQ
jgi:hypothetical protein